MPLTFPKQDNTTDTYTSQWVPTIRINVEGDERLGITNPIYVDVSSFDGITWKDVKKQMEEKTVFKAEWSKDDYGIYDWKKEDDSLIDDNTAVTDGMKVYARTNYKRFKWDENKPTELIGYEGGKPRGKIIFPAKTTKIWQKPFKDCPEITDADITECNELSSLDLRGTGIREIDLTVCPKLTAFSFNDCKNLEKVIARNLKEVTSLQDFFAGCTALKHIDLTGCDKLKTIGGLYATHYQFKECTALETLDITGCTSLKKIDLAETKIKKLIGIKCQKAEEINLSNCKNLEEIDLQACDLLISQTPTEKKITKLNFSGSVNAIVTLPMFFLDSFPEGAFGSDTNTYCKKVRVRGIFWKEKVKATGYPEEKIEIYTT